MSAMRLAVSAIAIVACLGLMGADANAKNYATGHGAFSSQDFRMAFQIWKPLAEAGASDAQLGLAVLYETGRGAPLDPVEAARWYEMAAEQGVTTAQYNLGRMYAEGRGVPQDFIEAARLWLRAAEGGSTAAQHNLGVMYYSGDGVSQDYGEAAAWFSRSSDAGFSESQYMLGEMHRLGLGVERNQDRAVRWLALAARQSHDRARQRLMALGHAPGQSQGGDSTGSADETAPEPADSTATLTPAAEPPATSAAAQPGTAAFNIWLASFRSPDNARYRWGDLRERHGDLFAGLEPVYKRVEIQNQGVFYRLQAGALATKQHADTICAEFRRREDGAFCESVAR